MTQRGPGGHDDDHLPDQFLVDGVAPSVIGGGPDESPFEAAPDTEPLGRQRQEPPTSPIPALGQQQQEKRKSWLSRMFRG